MTYPLTFSTVMTSEPNYICFPTLAAVRRLSPVIMTILYLASWRALIFDSVSYFKGELQTINPENIKLFSKTFL